MKTRNPKSRFDLNVSRSSRVLEVGGGHNPHPRSNVVVDKYVDSNFHRSGNIKIFKNQTFLDADGENLPFKDKEFDYVICCHVLEHVENPIRFLSEQFRVARRGYIETPSLLGEYFAPRESHKWIINEFNDKLYLVDKKKMGFTYGYDMGKLIQQYLPTHSIGFKIMERTHPNLLTVRIEWEHDFNYEIEPQDPVVRQFFTGAWEPDWANKFFPPKSMGQEFKDAASAFINISRSVFKSKVVKKKLKAEPGKI